MHVFGVASQLIPLPPPTHTPEQFLGNEGEDTWLPAGASPPVLPHHGVGLATACLPVCHDTHVVPAPPRREGGHQGGRGGGEEREGVGDGFNATRELKRALPIQ